MEFIKGFSFGFMNKRGEWQDARTKESLQLLKERCAVEHIVLTVVAEQDTPQSITINWRNHPNVVSDEETIELIECANKMGLKVILKPMVNVSDGTWRAHINFFDTDVPCEPKWSEWFASYNEYILHYAKIAEEMKCPMFVIGCELVNADRREAEWRHLIKEVRKVYSGLITYNCDKYQEDVLKWWDAVDVISSSGYYPIDAWETQLDRIEKVVEKHQKPFFFCEAGCPSWVGGDVLPNDWTKRGKFSEEVQKSWYEAMFKATSKRSWVKGFALWDWKAHLYPIERASSDQDYAVYGKAAEKVIKDYYSSVGGNEEWI
ncbi:1,4-beta-xylanase [Cytobacillus oceanisediminis]|uniref:1,4-beta-xylanase n=1 Tax=Niallia alba TaxID=2729105 RepID=A0A7Y0PQK0_9BACI|nr:MULTISPECIES: 1,4-beta-xylanase [Bacillaceae]MBZ9535083.1 1,4-beta-xylanase [Cytobacillus oceanisediminis]MDU1847655.1 1,4-beta-xylanase [Niallia nealsonii]NMO79624.1 1,4-beta-xylanase [Niallia alba]